MAAHSGSRKAKREVAYVPLDPKSPYVQTIPSLVLPGRGELTNLSVRASQIYPGYFEPVSALPEFVVPKIYGYVELKRDRMGNLQTFIKVYAQEVTLKESEGGAILGSPGVCYQTIRRLRLAGFVDGSSLTPNKTTIDVQSWFQHREAARDPDFWNKARRRQFKDACYAGALEV